ncbi:unnamed protein product [Caenorhabditis angaria]|uniref:RING-type domain-containing protein n=1 Tax=Caenorhabditis angaria TaxID=860376 RepID=A0A9P1IP31_9PELO|nr:unnamed protein product [Caenorhabditis angaria]
MTEVSCSFQDSYCIDDSLIACEICFEPFNHENRPPKLLPCGHNFCETCIFSMCCHQEYYLLDSIKCPTCRRSFPTNTARQAPTNYDLCRILENVHKKKEQNVTVIHLTTPRKSQIEKEKKEKKPRTIVTAKCKNLADKTEESKHLRCSECQRKFSQKNLFRVARYCVDCTSTSRMTIVCLECCVNQHNGHELYSEDQLHHNQLKVLSELRGIRRKVVDCSEGFDKRSEELRDSGKDVCISLTSEKQNLLIYTLASIDDVVRRIENAPIMFPPVLQTIRDEQIHNYQRLSKLSKVLENSATSRKNTKPSKTIMTSSSPSTSANISTLSIRQSKVSLRGDDVLFHDSIDSLCRLIPSHPMSIQLNFHHSTVSPKDTVEERKRKIMSCAHAASCMLDSETTLSMIPLFADVLLNCFYQLNKLSKNKFDDKKSCRRIDIWKQIQISYSELLNISAKNFPAFHPERVDILDDLAYLCHLYSDVCDQATVTICIIEAARARSADSSSLTEMEQRKTEERLELIDQHLTECRRQQKLAELCKTSKTKKTTKTHGKFKRLFGSCFMPKSKK